jgi:hypothetical protein
MPKPPLGKVAVGDRLIVIPASYNNRIKQEPVEAVVVKVARIWVELDEVEGPRSWRLRLDTQHDGGNGNYHDRFLTTEQHAWGQREQAVHDYLSEAGVSLKHGSRWGTPEERLTLANLLRQHDGLDPL